ncbi:MAG: acetylxylan esterase [Lentisphaeria bacterium]|nr:acetylxylan esterase [Lentisphaeria bacterium]
MNIRVWNADLPPFPREGIFHLEPADDCPVTRLLCTEAGRLSRLSQFEAPADMAELRAFKKKLRKKIWEKIGTVYDGSLPLDVKIYGKVQRDGYTITRLTYQSRPGVHVTGLLYIPDGDGPFPGVMHMHGHSNVGKFGDRIQLTSQALVKAGYVCLTVDAFGVYERACDCHALEYHGGFPGGALLNIGESLMGEQIVDNMRGVDLLESLDCVIPHCIGATGASGGGNQTMYLAAMDERIKVAMPVVSVGSYESYVNGVNCICELLPDGLTFTDEAGVLALIAPRPLNIGNALYDCNHTFSVGEMLKTYHLVERVYWNLGVPENLRYTVANRVHGMHDQQRQAMIGWMDLHLKGIGSGNPVESFEGVVEPPEALRVFASAKDRPAEVCGTDVYCIRQGKMLREKMLASGGFDRSSTLAGLAKVLRLRKLPAQMPLKRYKDVDGIGRYALDQGDHLLPVLVKPGEAKGKFKLLLSPKGKADVSGKWVAEASADGSTVVLCDLFGSGETARSNHLLAGFHQTLRQLLWIGRSLPGEWTLDIMALVKMLKKDFKAADIRIEAEKEVGLSAVFAAALSKDDFTVKAIDVPGSLLFCRESIPSFVNDPFKYWSLPGALYTPAMSLPGFLKWGDVSLAAALAEGKVEFVSPRAYDGTLWSAERVKEFTAEVAALAGKLK